MPPSLAPSLTLSYVCHVYTPYYSSSSISTSISTSIFNPYLISLLAFCGLFNGLCGLYPSNKRAELIHSHSKDKAVKPKSIKPIYVVLNTIIFGVVGVLIALDNILYSPDYTAAATVKTVVEKVKKYITILIYLSLQLFFTCFVFFFPHSFRRRASSSSSS